MVMCFLLEPAAAVPQLKHRACAAAAAAAGQGSFRDGGDGTDCYIKVPVGTIIRRKEAEVSGWIAGGQAGP